MPFPLLETIHSPADLKKMPVEQLPALAAEIRTAICQQVAQSGGHLAPNLGVVELTIALHHVFDFGPRLGEPGWVDGLVGGDRLLFDVGHQSYVHKLLTGRLPLLGKLRQKGGMGGFPEPAESPFDLFAVGHAGTAISTAVGLARADAIKGEAGRKSVALIGDASIVNGVALEGLNNAGTLKRQFLVVLNDNGMSIGKPQGGMAGAFDRLRVSHAYTGFKKSAHAVLEKIPGGELLEKGYHRASEAIKCVVEDRHAFEDFGLVCVGPVDGHDLPSLISMLREVREMDRPVLLHVKTTKGKGYAFAEGDSTYFHSPSPFKMEMKQEGCRVELSEGARSFTDAYADAMIALMKEDPQMVAITAAMPNGTGVDKIALAFPERTLDVGICESHAMDMAAGMAKAGLKPFFAVYSTFAQRALDQLFQEVSLQKLPVRVCMDRAGYVGSDGAVHHGFMDIAMARALPDVVMLAPCDEPTLLGALRFMKDNNTAATMVRYPRDKVPTPINDQPEPFALGKAALAWMNNPDAAPELAVLAYGVMVYPALEAAKQFVAKTRKNVAVYDARFAQPVDIELAAALTREGIPILTVEDHALTGGFGSAVLEALNELRLPTHGVVRMGHPKKWFGPDSRAAQLKDAGLSVEVIEAQMRWMVGAK